MDDSSMSDSAESESRGDDSAPDVSEIYKTLAVIYECIGALQSKILDSIPEGHPIREWVTETMDMNEGTIEIARMQLASCPLSESEQRTLVEEAKAAARTHLGILGLDDESSVDGEQVDNCERGGQVRVVGNVSDMNIIMSSQSASSASSLGIEQRQERGAGSNNDGNPRPRQRRKTNKSSGRTSASDTAVPFDEARFKEAIMSETDLLVESFETLNCGQDEEQPLAIETSVVTACKLKLVGEFSSGQLDVANVNSILEHVRCLSEGIAMFRAEQIGGEQKATAILQSIPDYSESQSRGDFLSSLSKSAKVDFSSAISEAENGRASVRAILKALGKDKRGNDRTLTATVLREYAVPSNAVKNILQILGHISSAIDVYSDFSVDELFSRSNESKRLAAELYRERFESDLDGTSCSALELIVDVVVPFLRKDACVDKLRAVKLDLAICEQSLNTNEGRMNLIYRKFKASASKSMESSGGTVQSTTDYFGCPDRRREATVALHGLILADTIDAKTPVSILEKYGGFARRAVGLSWKDLTRSCRRIVRPDFFGTDSEASFSRLCAEADFPLPEKAAKEVKTKVVIYNRKQMESLQALARFED